MISEDQELHQHRFQTMSLDEFLEIEVMNDVLRDNIIISEREWDVYLEDAIKRKKTPDFWKDYVSILYVVSRYDLSKEMTIDIARRTKLTLFRHRQHPYIRRTDIDILIKKVKKQKHRKTPEYTRPLEEYSIFTDSGD